MKLLVPYLIALSMGLLSCSGPSEVVTDDGVTLSYQIAGDGDTTVLFLHGWCIDKTYWDSQVRRLNSRYRVVTIDHAGHGASKGSHAEWTPARLGKDIAQAIDQLDLRNIVLVGHSMSGTIMLETHAIAGDRVIGLIGVDNFKELTPALTEPQSKEMKEFLGYFSSNYTSVATEYVKASLFTESSPPQAVERVLADVLRMDSAVSVKIIAQLVTWGPREIELLRQQPDPLLLLNSSATLTDTIALDKQCVSGFRLFDVGPTGHYPMIESPDRFNEAMEEALTLIGRGK